VDPDKAKAVEELKAAILKAANKPSVPKPPRPEVEALLALCGCIRKLAAEQPLFRDVAEALPRLGEDFFAPLIGIRQARKIDSVAKAAPAPGAVVRVTGRVKSYNQRKGFGFIDIPGYPRDIFVYNAHLIGRTGLVAGEAVSFELCVDGGRPQARQVRPAPGGVVQANQQVPEPSELPKNPLSAMKQGMAMAQSQVPTPAQTMQELAMAMATAAEKHRPTRPPKPQRDDSLFDKIAEAQAKAQAANTQATNSEKRQKNNKGVAARSAEGARAPLGPGRSAEPGGWAPGKTPPAKQLYRAQLPHFGAELAWLEERARTPEGCRLGRGLFLAPARERAGLAREVAGRLRGWLSRAAAGSARRAPEDVAVDAVFVATYAYSAQVGAWLGANAWPEAIMTHASVPGVGREEVEGALLRDVGPQAVSPAEVRDVVDSFVVAIWGNASSLAAGGARHPDERLWPQLHAEVLVSVPEQFAGMQYAVGVLWGFALRRLVLRLALDRSAGSVPELPSTARARLERIFARREEEAGPAEPAHPAAGEAPAPSLLSYATAFFGHEDWADLCEPTDAAVATLEAELEEALPGLSLLSGQHLEDLVAAPERVVAPYLESGDDDEAIPPEELVQLPQERTGRRSSGARWPSAPSRPTPSSWWPRSWARWRTRAGAPLGGCAPSSGAARSRACAASRPRRWPGGSAPRCGGWRRRCGGACSPRS
ncbi:unnamed protein product, partial [Prorocentrum cordatum]